MMPSVFKAKGAAKYTILYVGETGRRRKKAGATDKAVTERIARDIENKIALRREGVVDPAAEGYRDHEVRRLSDHIAAWQADLVAKGNNPKHAEHASNRVRRLVTVILGATPAAHDPRRLAPSNRRDMTPKLVNAIASARLSTLTREKVQDAIAQFQAAGTSLQTCNHYRAATRAFSTWAWKNGRTREDLLRGVTGFNAKEDPRHDRRTIALDELRQLIDTASRGPKVLGMSGPARSLCYRLAVGPASVTRRSPALRPSRSTGKPPA